VVDAKIGTSDLMLGGQTGHHPGMPSMDAAIADLDARFLRAQADGAIPGLAWGVVHGGSLIHASGVGTIRDGADRRPDAESVFRIASMTKSFTAATLLSLRDEGRVRLDAPVADYVPELQGWAPPTADIDPITVRQLLTMSAGLPTDDPWGDRQQDLDLDRFADLLRAGPTLAWPPGTTFEYSNLGYGILGRVVTNAAGMEYDDVVRERILRPLGMDASTFRQEHVPDEALVHGYVRRDDRLVREGTDGYGALASMAACSRPFATSQPGCSASSMPGRPGMIRRARTRSGGLHVARCSRSTDPSCRISRLTRSIRTELWRRPATVTGWR
jgi:CubicO group peptidase (beta-lactamase class C family)